MTRSFSRLSAVCVVALMSMATAACGGSEGGSGIEGTVVIAGPGGDLGAAYQEAFKDFTKKEGTLRLPTGCSCDMSGCLALFAGIDPNVQRIDIYAGRELETYYARHGSRWVAEGGPT